MTGPAGEAGAGPRIGVWGTFDVENYGDMLFARVARHELARRLPQASVRVFAPIGYTGLNRFDSGEPMEPLGAWSPERAAELAEQLDCVVVGGGEIIHWRDDFLAPHYGLPPQDLLARAPSRFFIEGLGPSLESSCPVLWNAVGVPFEPTAEEAERFRRALGERPYVAVRDEVSRKRLESAGVEAPIEVVPDTALLLSRIFEPQVLDKRLEFLRAVGWFPPEDVPALAVQGDRGLVPFVPQLAEQVARLARDVDGLRPVLVETGPCHGDHEFADRFQDAFEGQTDRLGPAASVEDVAAAIRGSAGFVGNSLHGNITAVAFRRPHVALNLKGQAKLEAFAGVVGDPDCVIEDANGLANAFRRVNGPRRDPAPLLARIDAHFDRIAEIAAESATRRSRSATAGRAGAAGEEPRPDAAAIERRAREVRAQRAAAERRVLADRASELEALAAHHRAEEDRLRFELDRAGGEVRRLESQLAGQSREANRWWKEAERLEAELGARTEEVGAANERLEGMRRDLGQARAALERALEDLERAHIEHEARSEELEAALRTSAEELEGRRRELSELLATRTFRYTAPLRALYGRLRRRRSS